MGLIYADIELINGDDLALARRHMIGEEKIKRMPVKVHVTSGSNMLAINENIQKQLQFPIVEKRKAHLSNGQIIECNVVSSVELRFKNKQTTCSAIVLPDVEEPRISSNRLDYLDIPVQLPFKRVL